MITSTTATDLARLDALEDRVERVTIVIERLTDLLHQLLDNQSATYGRANGNVVHVDPDGDATLISPTDLESHVGRCERVRQICLPLGCLATKTE